MTLWTVQPLIMPCENALTQTATIIDVGEDLENDRRRVECYIFFVRSERTQVERTGTVRTSQSCVMPCGATSGMDPSFGTDVCCPAQN